ncbi:MAG: M12 family metallo-peptidase, partial [Chitinophagaceae bacterium]
TKISAIKVWNIVDPYNSLGTTSSVLNAFSVNMANGFPGDLAHFLSQRGLGGGIAYLGVLCSSNSFKTGVSGNLSNSFNLFPAYSWSSMVITHELGHNLGSPHTQSCSWPGGAIDNCYTTEGGCPQGPAPVNGGTIMSYCHLTGYGINLANGFGPLPGQRIRDLVRNSTCIYPGVYFETTSVTVSEANADVDNGCLDYKLVTTKLKIPYEPSQPATINLLLNAGAGLVIGTDKDIEVTPLNFTLDGSNLSQTINLKVYNDALVENQESLTIDFSINANGGNAVKKNFFLPAVINIISDDYRPDSTSNSILYYEPFDGISSGLGNWTQSINYGILSPNRWIIGNSGDADFNSKAIYISNNGTSLAYSGTSLNDSAVVRIESPLINASTFSNLQLTYLYKCAGESKPGQGDISGGQWLDYGKTYFSIDGGIGWVLLKENIAGRNAKVTESLTLPPSANNATNLKIAFEWLNNSSIVNNPPFIIDSIVIKGASVSPIQSASEPGNIDEQYVGPFQTVHFYNPISKSIIATIENTSAFDFGCTKVELVRTGVGAALAWGTVADQKISDKIVRVTPTNNNESAPYNLKIYYTNDEVTGWLAATGNKLSDVRLVKTTADLTLPTPVLPAVYSSINNRQDYGLAQHSVVSGSFTGFSSFALMKAFSLPECQSNLVTYSAGVTGSTYQWQVNDGSGYSNISNDAVYSNATTASVSLLNPPASFIDNQYRCLVNTTYGIVYSPEFKLKYGATWLGSVSNAWENPLNWSCGALPDSKTDVVINGGTVFTPQLGSVITIRSLRLPGSSNLIIKSGFHLTVKQ